MTLALWNTVDQYELKRANALVTQQYQSSGYLLPTDQPLPDIRNYFPESLVFTIKGTENQLCGTIALIPDTLHKMPLDAMFSDEIRALREKGLKLAEVGRLAVTELPGIPPKESKRVLPALFSVALSWGFLLKLDALVITINPKHDSLYQHFGFRPLASDQKKSHPTLKNAPALARILFLQHATAQDFRFLPFNPKETHIPITFQQGKTPLIF